jgi:hypothetical protein
LGQHVLELTFSSRKKQARLAALSKRKEMIFFHEQQDQVRARFSRWIPLLGFRSEFWDLPPQVRKSSFLLSNVNRSTALAKGLESSIRGAFLHIFRSKCN